MVMILLCNLINQNNMGKLFLEKNLVQEQMNLIIKFLFNERSQELPYKYKAPFLKLYELLYLDVDEVNNEAFLFFIKECIVFDFH